MKIWLLLFAMLTAPAFAETQTIDPTKNVLDLVNAESKFQNSARDYEAKLRDVEMRRLKELAEQKERYDLETAKTLRANLDASTLLLATQLKETKSDLSDRVAKVERFQYETSGKTSGANELWVIIAAVGGLLIGAGGVAAGMWRRA
jgi:hypothetical protein